LSKTNLALRSMPIHYYNLSVSVLHLAAAGLLMYSFDEKTIPAIISLFFGIVFLSQNQPLQYENKPQIVVVSVLAIIAFISFIALSVYFTNPTEFPYTYYSNYILAVINLIYFTKSLLLLQSMKNK
jgi:hypothetical protein